MLRVKAERLRRAWSQTSVAYRAPLTPAEVSGIETGRVRPTNLQLVRLAVLFDLPVETLLEEVPELEAARLIEARSR